jgi:hypothetical protein
MRRPRAPNVTDAAKLTTSPEHYNIHYHVSSTASSTGTEDTPTAQPVTRHSSTKRRGTFAIRPFAPDALLLCRRAQSYRFDLLNISPRPPTARQERQGLVVASDVAPPQHWRGALRPQRRRGLAVRRGAGCVVCRKALSKTEAGPRSTSTMKRGQLWGSRRHPPRVRATTPLVPLHDV